MIQLAFFRSEKIQGGFFSLCFILTGLFLGGVLFYLTPLKHINILKPEVKKVAPTDFYDEYQRDPDRYIIVDIRSVEYRALEYLSTSISVPLNTLIGQIDALPRDKSIIIFCESNFSASVAYHLFKSYGFMDVHILDGGRTAWKEEGLPLEPGDADKIKIADEVIRLKKELGAEPG
ncbi:MAG: FAD-dependent pyridine nucleotide-disulfide oxidoreductase [Parcubacteria group bacterium Gr01-1014_48]|nr:MAG: FAD-dependent pyridine nucleotide-disulfide oxidoreductase [Parcubacteria group bacterium Gr01-1014_48]